MHADLKRVFFHELGHYVARTINLKNFGVMGKVAEIALFPSNRVYDTYEGVTTPVVPNGEDRKKPTVNVPEKLAVLTYGCFFESIYTGKDFTDCFKNFGNGGQDVSEWAGELFKLGILDKAKINAVDDEYFLALKKGGYLDDLFKIDVAIVLINEGYGDKGYIVDLKKLDTLIEKFIASHEKMYLQYLERIRSLVGK